MRKWIILYWFLFVVLILMVWWQWPDISPQVIVCDVGQGDGIIVTQGFSQMVIDVGRNNGAMTDCLGESLPFWDKEIEMMVITHADSDHAGGLREVQQSYRIDMIVTSEKASESIADVVTDATKVQVGLLGQSWVWGSVVGEVVWPPRLVTMSKTLLDSLNDAGLLMRLKFKGGDSAWFAADASNIVEEMLIKTGAVTPVTMLKVSHHGSKYATTQPFLDILQPRISVVSVGKNSYGHPSKEVLERLTSVGSTVMRTDQRGPIFWKPE